MTAMRKKKHLFSTGAAPTDADIRIYLQAVKDGRLPVAKCFVRKFGRHGKSPADICYSDGVTALMYAAKSGWMDVARFLVVNGADVNALDKWKDRSPLVEAVTHFKGDFSMIDFLAEKGAAINAVPLSALHAVMWKSGDVSVLRRLLSKKPDLDTRFNGNRSILHCAVADYRDGYHAKAAYISALIAGGCDIEARDEAGFTPLMLAAEMGMTEAFGQLLSLGANTDATDNLNQTLDEWLRTERGAAMRDLLQKERDRRRAILVSEISGDFARGTQKRQKVHGLLLPKPPVSKRRPKEDGRCP